MTGASAPKRIAHWLGVARQLVLDGPEDPFAWDGLLVAMGESMARAGHVDLGRAVLEDAVVRRDLLGSGLSRRETQVAELVARGMTNREVARVLQLSPRTVETYLARLFTKLDASCRAEVAGKYARSPVRTPDPNPEAGPVRTTTREPSI